MNIQEAKETIEKALRAYFARDEIGFPLVPLRQQRPILLIGPPGIGKTAIMEQIAEECGVGLVAYTMTHHTRQSAMGLPEICKREIEGKILEKRSAKAEKKRKGRRAAGENRGTPPFLPRRSSSVIQMECQKQGRF